MYEFIENISEKDYTEFYLKNKACFMQSYEWGQFNKISRNQTPHYVGLKKNKKIVCEALLLEKKGVFNLSYFYSPRGFIIDFKNEELLNEFSAHLKNYIKKHNGIYLKLDPEIEYHEIDETGRKLENGYNNYDVYNAITKSGFKHTGFTKNFDNNQPRYTFIIDLSRNIEELEKNIHKSVMKKIKKTYEYNMIFRESKDVDTFYKLLTKTSEKDNFMPNSKEYYKNACKILENTYKLFELVINPKELYSNIKEKFNNTKSLLTDEKTSKKQISSLEESLKRLEKEIIELEPYKNNDELVICSQMCAVTNDTLWTLYIGNDEIGKNLYAVNRMYLEVIKYAKETNHKYLDLFGTTGDPINAPKNLGGIHKFKQNFGGKYIEFIGEFDYINKKILYKLLPIVLKLYRKSLKFYRKRKR